MKIYISSTYTDLREHRAAVDLALRRMGHDVIGMEQYVAESMTPLARCLADVRAADLYVVILGWRYGYVPTDEAANPDRLSITHLEFEQARAAGKPVLAFLLDVDAPWPPSSSDAFSTEGWDRIRDLRAQLGGGHLAGIFRTPDNLASQVAAAVSAQGISRHMVERALAQHEVGDSIEAFGRGDVVSETSLAEIVRMIGTAGATRTILIPLDIERGWWSTRLYLLAVLAERLTGVRQFLFSRADGRFVAMATPAAVRAGLRMAFPDIAMFDDQMVGPGASRDVDRETSRCVQLWTVSMGAGEAEIKVGVRPHLLAEWLGERLVTRCVEVDPEVGITLVQVQQLVDSLIRDVPVQQHRHDLPRPFELMVVDRDAFGLELARQWVRAGLPRTPTR